MEDITQLYNHLAKLPLDSKMKEIENILKKKKGGYILKEYINKYPEEAMHVCAVVCK